MPIRQIRPPRKEEEKMFLGSEKIRMLILKKGLMKDYIDLDSQLQPNGFDMTLQKIYKLHGIGEITCNSKVLPELEEIITSSKIWYLKQGVYLIQFNEVVNLPKNIAAFSIQRSSIIRSGAMINVASWDSGYNGRGQNILFVNNPDGLCLEKNARVVQMHFLRVEGKHFSYNGHYQKENIKEK